MRERAPLRWMPDELASAGRENLDIAHASQYDHKEDARADIEEHVRDEHSTFTWLLEAMMERTGFRIEQAEYSADRIFAKYIARAV